MINPANDPYDDEQDDAATLALTGDTERALARADAIAAEEAQRVLAPARAALTAVGFYAYITLDDQNRWSIASDSEYGHVDVRIGSDGYAVELWQSSPGLYADEENEFRQRVLERVARMTLPRLTQGLLAPHQTAAWDEVDHGVVVRIAYELPFSRVEELGIFAQERLPELDELLAYVEQQVTS